MLRCKGGLVIRAIEGCRPGLALATAAVCLFFAGSAAHATGSPQAQAKMGDPILGLTAGELSDFMVGKVAYGTNLEEFEGLGPAFNKESCGGCHNNPFGGPGTSTVTRFGTTSKGGGFDPLASLGGSLLQADAINDLCREDIPGAATITQTRITNGMLGYGLVEAIPDADLLANETTPPSPNVSGIAHMVEAFEAPGIPRVGRFGWKAQVPTILTFSADAANNEMGLTNVFLPNEQDPNGDHPPSLGAPDNCDVIADPEDNITLGNGVDKTFIEVVTDFQRFLAQPPQTPKSGMNGEAVFTTVGCSDCHVPSFTTDDGTFFPSLELTLQSKVIRPYSDFLLHNMGLEGDPIVQGAGVEQEVKTPPLWGLRVRDPVWHNGELGGGTFEDRMNLAIARHDSAGSEAQISAQAYAALSQPDKDDLIAFLNSLGRVEFDTDGDGDVDLADFHGFGDPAAFAACFGPGPYTADDPCAVHDVDQDGDVDLADFKIFLTVYTGPLDDCQPNGVLDLQDILVGTSSDDNFNGVPDDCCPGDINGDGVTNVLDLIDLLLCFGLPAVPGCEAADGNNDGVVNVLDLIDLLLDFGLPCP